MAALWMNVEIALIDCPKRRRRFALPAHKLRLDEVTRKEDNASVQTRA